MYREKLLGFIKLYVFQSGYLFIYLFIVMYLFKFLVGGEIIIPISERTCK